MFKKPGLLFTEITVLDAWIITGGTNGGVMKYVGAAVSKDKKERPEATNSVVTVGVATWGTLLEGHRKELRSVANTQVY